MTTLALLPGLHRSGDVGWLVDCVVTATGLGVRPFTGEGDADRLSAVTFGDVVSAAEVLAATVGALPGIGPEATRGDIALYLCWIKAQAEPSPFLFAARFNVGVALSGVGRRDAAIEHYRAALAVRPEFGAAAVNLGLCLEAEGQATAALSVWTNALQPTETRVALLNQRARLLEQSGRLDEAEAVLRDSLLSDANQPDAVQHYVHIRQKLCRWPVLPADIPGLSADAMGAQAGPLGTLAMTDDVARQRDGNARWLARKTQPVGVRLSPTEGYDHSLVRVGYLSSDFCRHAMSYLIAELLERHDRDRFQVYGYCSTMEDGSPIRRRMLAAFDETRMIRGVSDEAAARTIRDDEIDILVDLNGLTAGSRMQVLRWRPAPVQATYLGFIGPVPLPELDYLFCDDFVVPPELAGQYAPQPLSIGPLFQANDRRREVALPIAREEAGVPADAFVFCCFSNHYKITAEMFASWMAILRGAPRSVLWLNDDTRTARANLCAAATEQRVDASRLIFAPRLDPARYMARLRCADLFLDTFPYNAGTIASDALRMGLPLLTLRGRSFASRMAARALLAIGAHAGIAQNRDDYVARAISFANDPSVLAAFRSRVTPEAWERTLGDTEAFADRYEAALLGIVRKPDRAQGDATVRVTDVAAAPVG